VLVEATRKKFSVATGDDDHVLPLREKASVRTRPLTGLSESGSFDSPGRRIGAPMTRSSYAGVAT
jgi:hypothetical protein